MIKLFASLAALFLASAPVMATPPPPPETLAQIAQAVHNESAGQLIYLMDADSQGDAVAINTSAGGIYYHADSGDPLIQASNAVCDFSKQWTVTSNNTIFCIAK